MEHSSSVTDIIGTPVGLAAALSIPGIGSLLSCKTDFVPVLVEKQGWLVSDGALNVFLDIAVEFDCGHGVCRRWTYPFLPPRLEEAKARARRAKAAWAWVRQPVLELLLGQGAKVPAPVGMQ